MSPDKPKVLVVDTDTETYSDIIRNEDSEEVPTEMHKVDMEPKKRLMNRKERRTMIAQTLTRDERLMVQEMKHDITKALTKPKGLSKAQLRRRRRKDAAR